jgi:glycosidase
VFVGNAEEQIARFIGRTTTDGTDMVGVDAALDYPLFFKLKPVVKGFSPPSDLVSMYQLRKRIEANVLSSHGDATRFFVTFLDNHDVKERIRFVQAGNEHQFDDQVTLGLGCLYSLPGIPCLYYGTEQGLHGSGSDAAVREALWGGPGFQRGSFYYKQISALAGVRTAEPPLRYGRFYFRPISGDGQHFGVSAFPQGVLAFSRILMDQEIVVAANCSTSDSRAVDVIVDLTLNQPADQYRVRYSNKAAFQSPGPVQHKAAGTVSVQEADGGSGSGPLRSIRVTLAPLEVQILGR